MTTDHPQHSCRILVAHFPPMYKITRIGDHFSQIGLGGVAEIRGRRVVEAGYVISRPVAAGRHLHDVRSELDLNEG